MFTDRSFICDKFVNQFQLSPDEPKEGVAPKHDQYQLDYYFIETVFFFHMHQFMLKDLLARFRLEIYFFIPEDEIEKGEGRTLCPGRDKLYFLNPLERMGLNYGIDFSQRH